MSEAGDALSGLVDVLSDPSRFAIALEVHRSGETTSKRLSERLGLHISTVTHHVHRLMKAGVLEQARVAVGPTYIEKYLRLAPSIAEAFRASPQALSALIGRQPPRQRQAITATLLVAASHLLRQMAKEVERMPPEQYARIWDERPRGLIAITLLPGQVPEAEVAQLLNLVIPRSHPGSWANQHPGHVLIVAALPRANGPF